MPNSPDQYANKRKVLKKCHDFAIIRQKTSFISHKKQHELIHRFVIRIAFGFEYHFYFVQIYDTYYFSRKIPYSNCHTTKNNVVWWYLFGNVCLNERVREIEIEAETEADTERDRERKERKAGKHSKMMRST